jgi:NADP-dependent 3-hydroxy acid dehydrogenase YdfG
MSAAPLVAIITGAVGNLGFATAQAFQAAGHRTVLVDRSADRLRDAFKSIAESCLPRSTRRKIGPRCRMQTSANGSRRKPLRM